MRRSEAEVRQAIHSAVDDAVASSGAIANHRRVWLAACGGFAAAGRRQAREQLRAFVSECTPGARIEIVPDVRVAFEGALAGQDGVVVISGTGSIAYGRTLDGRELRVGGWGPEISDEGSGTAIGREALATVLRAFDGREPPTMLRELVLARWQADDEDALIEHLRAGANGHSLFAELLRDVIDAAGAGDQAATRILRDAGSGLAALATHVAHRLALTRGQIAITGGVFVNAGEVRQAFIECIKRELPEAVVEPARESPVQGALRMALALAHSQSED